MKLNRFATVMIVTLGAIGYCPNSFAGNWIIRAKLAGAGYFIPNDVVSEGRGGGLDLEYRLTHAYTLGFTANTVSGKEDTYQALTSPNSGFNTYQYYKDFSLYAFTLQRVIQAGKGELHAGVALGTYYFSTHNEFASGTYLSPDPYVMGFRSQWRPGLAIKADYDVPFTDSWFLSIGGNIGYAFGGGSLFDAGAMLNFGIGVRI